MHVRLQAPPWGVATTTPELEEAIRHLGDGVWSEAATDFCANRLAKSSRGLRAPKGMQGDLNRVIQSRMETSGWIGNDGRFAKGQTWLRVTFRHQMSLGSDLIDAMRMCRREHYELAVILAADIRTLRLISPNDAGAIVSFEKLRIAVADLVGVTDIPLLIGCLTPRSQTSPGVESALAARRPRDITMPGAGKASSEDE